jgi:hypothetical protein
MQGNGRRREAERIPKVLSSPYEPGAAEPSSTAQAHSYNSIGIAAKPELLLHLCEKTLRRYRKVEVTLADRMIVGLWAEHPLPIELIAYESSIIKKNFSRCRINVLIAKRVVSPTSAVRIETTYDSDACEDSPTHFSRICGKYVRYLHFWE